ncbi:bifunctional proline dehydrogenase/L-glutamate gamma-semialdehyde dehydrogenase [Wenyingzhuangia sp. 2_MG-2023]|uniref:bifunctional proline dehydrogenase/L-glutamate gamma-semialdehyde dehydrogenase n=1 Tax=Wenyingzhuangia sp. 2_MG-2023 TaxID=3062639 RepID=UPI0026E1FB50|nr:bifunctional proline dehydrogenase/L-glutamate gamma-semialdehyde dehydrogenase [Wenyingzhuangia sp. 2_MG-2023]MDO6737935.1 bifunctional proline dehydrogenase/L-glutamate gamma-semialdehyde dehydrogenase [Wenyingzhuangia sp. 2_MG-2023]MDO6802711.1 bifunctional proline dehydrogenase/L-glutamate gamma-semialdehyde dehydrogenase [Wenyingzhuangia sp. 1_MG-2023]
MEKQIQNTLRLAEKLQKKSKNIENNPFSDRLKTIIEVPESKHFLIQMMDVAFRSKNYKKVADHVIHLLKTHKNYQALFTPLENFLLQTFTVAGKLAPSFSVAIMLKKIQATSSDVVFFINSQKFKKHTQKRKEQNITLNINLIGEALIGEDEAQKRILGYLALLNRKDVNYISIKISTIFSQISSLAHEDTVEKLSHRLCMFYDEILKIEKETGVQKFVNLDMEEYKDLEITYDVFVKTLSLPEYKNIRAGIVLQAYIPEMIHYYRKLFTWASQRINNGGSAVKVRLVKGANMEMEMTEASIEDWSLATYGSKKETDANYKKILSEMLTPQSARVVNVGVASHNIFDISFALHLVKENQLEDCVDFEMLEGMANQLVDNLLAEKVRLLLYTPTVKENQYNAAIAYLVRRLDEGTQKGNFLKEGYDLTFGSQKWDHLKEEFLRSINLMETLKTTPNRIQDRNTEIPELMKGFHNVPNTDWNLPQNITWAQQIKSNWENPENIIGTTIPVVGDLDDNERYTIKINNWSGTPPWSYEMSIKEDYQKAIDTVSEWQEFDTEKRAHLLKKAAIEIEKNRADLIGVAVAELGKNIKEVDVEVSEAIDFANFYAESSLEIAKEFTSIDTGINLILSPWNFPIAIPIGGVLASLAAGKKVILKPSTNASACAYLTCKCLWEAGIPKSALYFLPCEESILDDFLSTGNVFDAVILTGGTETAHFLLERNPQLNLYAETGGKNNTIVTSLADKEQAAVNIVQSAFGNAGQKCSATSLLILTEDVYNDKEFKALLKDATLSKLFGNPWDFSTEIGPLAVPISEKLKHVIQNTPDNQWLVKPRLNGNHMLSPGIIWDVTTEDYSYQNELFGPIVSVLKADNLENAVEIANNVAYGLTAGLESLDENEIEYWNEHIEAGNKYVNRSTTGAIVQRQPFGGIKASCFGFGMKAGGINYVLQFTNIKSKTTDWKEDYQKWYDLLFSKKIDYVNLRGQYNICSYNTYKEILLLYDVHTPQKHIDKVEYIAEFLNIPLIKDTCGNALKHHPKDFTCVRALGVLSDHFLIRCHQHAIPVYNQEPRNSGRIELLNYLIEQSYSHNYHRYGNLMGVEYNATEKPKFY